MSKIVLCEQRTKNGDSLLGFQLCDKNGSLILAVGTCSGPRASIADGEQVLGFKLNQATTTGFAGLLAKRSTISPTLSSSSVVSNDSVTYFINPSIYLNLS